jgi:hypothetical protein
MSVSNGDNDGESVPDLLRPRRPTRGNRVNRAASVVLSSVGSSKDAIPVELSVGYPATVELQLLTEQTHTGMVMTKDLADQLAPWLNFIVHKLSLVQDDVKFLRAQIKLGRNPMELYKSYKNASLDSFKRSWMDVYKSGGTEACLALGSEGLDAFVDAVGVREPELLDAFRVI